MDTGYSIHPEFGYFGYIDGKRCGSVVGEGSRDAQSIHLQVKPSAREAK